MLKRLILMMLILMPLTFLEARAIARYNIFIEENGEAGVVIEVNATGLVTIPIQSDSSGLKVKGALYRLENDSLELSIASTQKAVVLYKTAMLTSKQGENWAMQMELLNGSDITVALPKHAEIKSTSPKAFIGSEDYNKLVFNDANQIRVEYVFKEKIQDNLIPIAVAAGAVAAGGAGIAFYLAKRRKPVIKNSAKLKILKTLSENEKVIVQTIIDRGEMKRSDLEKTTKMAKSSLANTLNNLEKKNIIEIDKTYTTHFIRFTGWFNEL